MSEWISAVADVSTVVLLTLMFWFLLDRARRL